MNHFTNQVVLFVLFVLFEFAERQIQSKSKKQVKLRQRKLKERLRKKDEAKAVNQVVAKPVQTEPQYLDPAQVMVSLALGVLPNVKIAWFNPRTSLAVAPPRWSTSGKTEGRDSPELDRSTNQRLV